MKKKLPGIILMFIFLLIISSSFTISHAVEQPGEAYEGYLVRLSDTAGLMDKAVFSKEESYEVVPDRLLLVDDLETAQIFVESGRGVCYEPNYILTLQENPYIPDQWNLLAVKAQSAWDHIDQENKHDMLGNGVTVAVIDSGVYTEHPDLNTANIMPNHNISDTDTTGAGWNGWHGTFVTGIIAAQVNNGVGIDGLSPNVHILPICVTNEYDKTTISIVIQAIDYAIEQNADVINLSVGGNNQSDEMKEACQRAVDAGIIVVAAAGNYISGTKSEKNYMYPASYDCVVSVSACKQGSTPNASAIFASEYSYFNDQVTVSAPGSEIVSLYIDNNISTKSGTSFSAPAVTAMAAMAKQRNSFISPSDFSTLLCESADDFGEQGYDYYYGNGFVNIDSFAKLLDKSYTIEYDIGENAYFSDDDAVPISYTLASATIILPEPNKNGYKFLGWYEDADYSSVQIVEIPSGSIGNKSYYASWEEDETTPVKQELTGILKIEQAGPVVSGATINLTADSIINGEPIEADSSDYKLQWMRDNQPINGENGLTYTVKKEDRGHAISLAAMSKGDRFTGSIPSLAVNIDIDIPTVMLTATPDNKQVSLNWTVLDDGGSEITQFIVYVDNKAGLTLGADIKEYTFTGLKNRTVYSFKVEACNESLNGVLQRGFAETSATPLASDDGSSGSGSGGNAEPGSGGSGSPGGGGAGSSGGGSSSSVVNITDTINEHNIKYSLQLMKKYIFIRQLLSLSLMLLPVI